MKKVIHVFEPETTKKPIEFTYYSHPTRGWITPVSQPNDYDKIVYLGKCHSDGDIFAAYYRNTISIYKGHLNDGVY